MTSPIPDAQTFDGEIHIDEIRTGDIVFTARPSLLQDLFTRAGEPWRHVGMVVVRSGEPQIVEVAGPRFRMRPLAAALANLTAAAVARVPTTDTMAAERAAQWCCRYANSEQVYAWDDVILGGFIAVTRRFSLPEDKARLERMVSAAVASLDSERGPSCSADPPSLSCSAFVVVAFAEAGYPIDFDLTMPRGTERRPSLWELVRAGERPLRSAAGSRMTLMQGYNTVSALMHGLLAVDERRMREISPTSEYRRWASPGDIWRSPSIETRLKVDL